MPPDHVINTDPAGNSSAGAGDEITINVSTGPEQREVPDVATLSYADAVKKLSPPVSGSSSRPTRRRRPNRRTRCSAPSRRRIRRPPSPTRSPSWWGPVRKRSRSPTSGTDVGSGAEEPQHRRLHDDPHRPGQPRNPPVKFSEPTRRAGSNTPGGYPDHHQGLQGQSVRDAEPGRPVLDGRRTQPTCAGMDRVLVKGADVPNTGQRTNAVVAQSPPRGPLPSAARSR